MTDMKRFSLLLLSAVAMIACSPKNAVLSGDREILADGWTLSRAGASEKYDAQVPLPKLSMPMALPVKEKHNPDEGWWNA